VRLLLDTHALAAPDGLEHQVQAEGLTIVTRGKRFADYDVAWLPA
jgi:hypothetical protein